MTLPTRTLAFCAAVLVIGPAAAAEDGIGKRIFLEGAGDLPPCATCHTLGDAGAEGEIGPNLDEMKPETAAVRAAVRDGVGVMPGFGEVLSADEIDAVATYVSDATK